MLKILAISDTHGDISNLRRIIKNGEKYNYLIHLGDVANDVDEIEKIVPFPCAFVRGNCDFLSFLPDTRLVDYGGVKFFLTHGHRYFVKESLYSLAKAAKDNGARVVVYGHTHCPEIEHVMGVDIINPGSLSRPRQFSRKPSYAVITVCDDGSVSAEITELQD